MIDNATKVTIKEHLTKYCENAGSDNKAAAKIGISNAYISFVKNEKWNSLSDDMWRKFAKKLSVEITEQWHYAETTQSKSFLNYFEKCRTDILFRGIVSLSGSGKTFMLDRARLSQQNTFFVKCIEDITKKELYQEILLSIGKPHAKGSTLSLLKQIVAELEKRDSPLLIIDEIEDCKTSILRQVKDLYNVLEGISGVIILGTPNLKIRVERLRNSGALAFNQVYSRFSMEFIEIPKPSSADAAKIIRAQGITDTTDINEIINQSKDDLHDGIDFRTVKRYVQRKLTLMEGVAA